MLSCFVLFLLSKVNLSKTCGGEKRDLTAQYWNPDFVFEILTKLTSRLLSKELSLCQIQSQLSQPINKNVRINNSRMLVASDKNNFTPGYKENLLSLRVWWIFICVWGQVLYIESFNLCVCIRCVSECQHVPTILGVHVEVKRQSQVLFLTFSFVGDRVSYHMLAVLACKRQGWGSFYL